MFYSTNVTCFVILEMNFTIFLFRKWINKLFGSNAVDKRKLLEDLSNLNKSVANMIMLPTCRINPLNPDASIEKFLEPKPNLDYRFERKIAEMIIKETDNK